MAKIISINDSHATATDKEPVDLVTVKPKHGIVGDAHARNWKSPRSARSVTPNVK